MAEPRVYTKICMSCEAAYETLAPKQKSCDACRIAKAPKKPAGKPRKVTVASDAHIERCRRGSAASVASIAAAHAKKDALERGPHGLFYQTPKPEAKARKPVVQGDPSWLLALPDEAKKALASAMEDWRTARLGRFRLVKIASKQFAAHVSGNGLALDGKNIVLRAELRPDGRWQLCEEEK